MEAKDIQVGSEWVRRNGTIVRVTRERKGIYRPYLRDLELTPIKGRGHRSWKLDKEVLHSLKPNSETIKIGSVDEGRKGYDFIPGPSSVRIINRRTGLVWVAAFQDLLPLAIAAGIGSDEDETETPKTPAHITAKRKQP